jgi:hypothetical protein
MAHTFVLAIYRSGNIKTHIVQIIGEQYGPIQVDHLDKL